MAKTVPGGAADLYPLPPTVGFVGHDVRKQRLPQYSFGTQSKLKENSIGPGPASYNVSKIVRTGITKANIYTMAPKTMYNADKSRSPGPMAYQLRESPIYKGSTAPAYSMAKVNTFAYKNVAPSPNNYGIQDTFVKHRAPQYSIGVKKYLPDVVRSPGPATYPGGKLSVIKTASPNYSMAPRTNFVFKLYGPGSNYYSRMEYKPGNQQPKYSFGVRHSPRSGTMIVPCDNM